MSPEQTFLYGMVYASRFGVPCVTLTDVKVIPAMIVLNLRNRLGEQLP
jgi:hypothetical protein